MKFIKKILVLCLFIGSMFTLTGCATSVNMSDYIDIEISGYNTVGKANAYFDEEKFIEDYKDKIKIDVVKLEAGAEDLINALLKISSAFAYEEYTLEDLYGDTMEEAVQDLVEEILDYDNGAEALADCLSTFYRLDKSSQLSNGDKVNLIWLNNLSSYYNEHEDEFEVDGHTKDETKAQVTMIEEGFNNYIKALNKMFDVNIKLGSKSVTVSDLEEVSTFNPFDHLEVKFSGIAPEGYVEYTADSSVDGMSSIYFSVEGNDGNLNVGDSVTIKAEYYSSEEEFANQYGKIMSETEKTYTCDGLSSYVTSISQIDAATLESMKSQCKDAYDSYMASNFGDYESLTSMNYLGSYVLTRKDMDTWYDKNKVFLVYKMEVNCDGTPVTYYFYYKFSDVIVNADGSVDVDLFDYDYPSNRYDSGVTHGYSTVKYRGYGSIDELYKDAIQSEVEYYTVESNVAE